METYKNDEDVIYMMALAAFIATQATPTYAEMPLNAFCLPDLVQWPSSEAMQKQLRFVGLNMH